MGIFENTPPPYLPGGGKSADVIWGGGNIERGIEKQKKVLEVGPSIYR
jgi:hypothetical protein